MPGKLDYTDISGENNSKLQHSRHFSIAEKIYHCGNIEERYRFNPPLPPEKDKTLSSVRAKYHKKKQKTKGKNRKKDTFRRSSTRRKKEVRRLVNSNVIHKKKTSFLTLTYRNTTLNEYDAKKHFNYFIKEINRRFPYANYNNYFCIIERQEERGKKERNRGCIHFHVIFFECNYLDYTDLNKVWKQGSTDIHQLRSVKNIGSYVSGYLSKDSSKLNGKILLCSQSLKRYTVTCNKKYTGFSDCQRVLFSHCYQQKYIKKNGEEFVRDIQIIVCKC